MCATFGAKKLYLNKLHIKCIQLPSIVSQLECLNLFNTLAIRKTPFLVDAVYPSTVNLFRIPTGFYPLWGAVLKSFLSRNSPFCLFPLLDEDIESIAQKFCWNSGLPKSCNLFLCPQASCKLEIIYLSLSRLRPSPIPWHISWYRLDGVLFLVIGDSTVLRLMVLHLGNTCSTAVFQSVVSAPVNTSCKLSGAMNIFSGGPFLIQTTSSYI